MTGITILRALKARIQNDVAGHVLLEAPRENVSEPPEMPAVVQPGVHVTHIRLGEAPPLPAGAAGNLVHPVVIIGYLPPKGLLPENSSYDAPAIIVGMDQNGGSDDTNSAELNIRLTFITYGAGTYAQDGAFLPDMMGYIDLLNLIDRTRQSLGANPTVGGITSIDIGPGSPMQWGMYEEQPWPYWYGWLSFAVRIPPVSPAYPEL